MPIQDGDHKIWNASHLNKPVAPKKHADEITSNSQLELGAYYHCFDKKTGRHEIHQCRDCMGHKCMGEYHIWACDDNNQALDRWRILGPIKAPILQ